MYFVVIRWEYLLDGRIWNTVSLKGIEKEIEFGLLSSPYE